MPGVSSPRGELAGDGSFVGETWLLRDGAATASHSGFLDSGEKLSSDDDEDDDSRKDDDDKKKDDDSQKGDDSQQGSRDTSGTPTALTSAAATGTRRCRARRLPLFVMSEA